MGLTFTNCRRSDNYGNWQNFVKIGKINPKVKPFIASSWKRCKDAGMDPRGDNVPNALSQQKLDELKARSKPLLDAAILNLPILKKALGKKPSVILLSDAEGHILHHSFSGNVGKYFDELGIATGGKDREDILGTTALSVTLFEQKPITVLLEEHYSEIFHQLCCASSPIFNTNGQLAGGINIAFSRDDASKIALIESLSIGTARCIQTELQAFDYLDKINGTKELTQNILEYMNRGVVVFDINGKIIHANRRANNIMFGLGDGPPFKNFHQLIESELLEAWHTSGVKTGKNTFQLRRQGARTKCFVKMNSFHDSSGRLLGSIALLEEENKKWPVRQEKAFSAKYSLCDIVGQSAGIKRAIRLSQRFSVSEVPILLYGDTGTGKEIFAQAIHNMSHRRNGPFVPLNCAAIPNGLVESELFGYARGAFTGASREGKKGKFEIASGGTLFLDEIDSMPEELQAKLLRVLETNEIVLLGDHNSKRVDVRLIAAIGGDTENYKVDTRIRKDLFYRISGVRIFLPPLKSRLEDIELLSHVFLKHSALKQQRAIHSIDQEAMEILKAYHWPGNVRELKSAIDFAVCIAESECLLADDLPDHVSRQADDYIDNTGSSDTMEEVEMRLLKKVLEENNGNRKMAAKAMGLSRTTFYRRCKKYNLMNHAKE